MWSVASEKLYFLIAVQLWWASAKRASVNEDSVSDGLQKVVEDG